MIRIALVDDHSLFRRGLKVLLASHADFEVVAEASSGEEFLGLLDTARPDVVFMDYSMGGISGAETTERALERMPELKVISLTMFGDNAYYSRMATSGAKGFLLKDSSIDEVIEAMETVVAGGSYFSPQLLQTIARNIHSPLTSDDDPISEREKEILVAICRGVSNQEIADELYISKRTVDKHRANILEKTGCKNTAALVIYAIKMGIIEI